MNWSKMSTSVASTRSRWKTTCEEKTILLKNLLRRCLIYNGFLYFNHVQHDVTHSCVSSLCCMWCSGLGKNILNTVIHIYVFSCGVFIIVSYINNITFVNIIQRNTDVIKHHELIDDFVELNYWCRLQWWQHHEIKYLRITVYDITER